MKMNRIRNTFIQSSALLFLGLPRELATIKSEDAQLCDDMSELWFSKD